MIVFGNKILEYFYSEKKAKNKKTKKTKKKFFFVAKNRTEHNKHIHTGLHVCFKNVWLNKKFLFNSYSLYMY